MMEVVIHDCDLSKMQKLKLRRKIREVWTGDEDAFHDKTEEILNTIYYANGEEQYNVMKFDYCKPLNKMEVTLERIDMETPEKRREQLRQKLREKIHQKRPNLRHGKDPRWEMYEQMRSRVPESAKAMIPSPDQVTANEEMYKSMMTMMPNQNPLHQYLSLFF
jgi:hypothetical protein